MKSIIQRVGEHGLDVLKKYPVRQFLVIALAGSQNYGLDTENSDVDTKMLIIPTLGDISMNREPVSKTSIRENSEHTDIKDYRLYFNTLKKQNPNFVEILFTNYYVVNPEYQAEWDELIAIREKIARLNPHKTISSMRGIVHQKYKQFANENSIRGDLVKKYGYDGKQAYHLLRIENFINKYIENVDYAVALRPEEELRKKLFDYKLNKVPFAEAKAEMERAYNKVTKLTEEYLAKNSSINDIETEKEMDLIAYEILKKSLRKEL